MNKMTACNPRGSSLRRSDAIWFMLPQMQNGFRIRNHKEQNKSPGVAAAMTRQNVTKSMPTSSSSALVKAPNSPIKLEKKKKMKTVSGKYGKFGGKFVPETLMTWLIELEAEFNLALHDSKFQEELLVALRDYVGRETPLYHAERLSCYYKEKNGGFGPEIYIKREDLCLGGAHTINNAIGQAMLAKRLRKKKIVAATGAGQLGVAAAAVCAKLALDCVVFMGVADMERQPSNVVLIKSLGAKVVPVKGSSKDASSEAFKASLTDFETSYYLQGSVMGPHPYPMMVREFQSVIGKEVRKQSAKRWGGKPDMLVACVGGGSNALGLFHEFIGDKDVRLVGVEAAGLGLETGFHSATLTKGSVGVYHGAMSYMLQDDQGQVLNPHSVGVGLECLGVSPELSYLKDIGRAEFHAVTDQDALIAFKKLCKLEGILPALESSHALAYLEELCPTFADGAKVVVNLSGRGDKDILSVHNTLMQQWTSTV